MGTLCLVIFVRQLCELLSVALILNSSNLECKIIGAAADLEGCMIV